MIQIFTDNGELVLYKDTTLNFEFNNALFASDAIDGDIAYSFEIPVKGNEIALEFGYIPQNALHKKYNCRILVHGVQFVSGTLYIQQAGECSLTACVVCNPYPDGWSEQSIRENESEEVVISNSIEPHKDAWKQFLKSTINDDRIKFGPILNEDGYGEANEDFGYYQGINRENICNRVAFDANNDVVESSDNPFVRLFNESIQLDGDEDGMYIERNQQCLLPQVRLGYILKNIVTNAGYKYLDRLSDNTELNRIYIQCTSPLDATGTQYDSLPTWYYLYATRSDTQSGFYLVSAPGYCNDNPQGLMWVHNSSQYQFYGIRLKASGWYHVQCHLTTSVTPHGEVLFKVAKWQSGNTPPVDPPNVALSVSVGQHTQNNDSFVYDNIIYIDSAYVGVSLAIGFWVKTDFYGTEREVWISGGEASLTLESMSVEQISYDNIFKNRFNFAELFPNTTNGDFLKAIIQSLGIAYYVDSASGTIELVPYQDIVDTKCIDLTDTVLIKETELTYPDEKKHIFRLSSLNDKDVNSDNVIEDCNDISDLPSPYENVGKLCYVRNANSYFKAEKVESEDSNWAMSWVDQKFNCQEISIGGSGDGSVTKSEVKVPDHAILRDYTIPSIPFTMCSQLYNSEDEPSGDIVMVYYRGLTMLAHSRYLYQDMLPVKANDFSLNANESKSICNDYIKEWQEMVHLSSTITYKMHVPIIKAIEIVQLLKPQKGSLSNQTRWIMVDNVKSMPKKISLQIDNNDGMVLCEIEAAVAN